MVACQGIAASAAFVASAASVVSVAYSMGWSVGDIAGWTVEGIAG